jgi:hypothetical protein
MMLFFSFHDKIFKPISHSGDSLNIKTRQRHSSLYTTFFTVVNRTRNATVQEVFLSFVIFSIEFIAFQGKRLHKCLSCACAVSLTLHQFLVQNLNQGMYMLHAI